MSVPMLKIFIMFSALHDKFSLAAFFSKASFTDTSQAAILSCWQPFTGERDRAGENGA